MIILGSLGLIYFVMLSVKFELEMLQQARSTAALIVPFALATIGLRIAATLVKSDEDDLQFEESLAPVVMELGLHRDGFMPIGAPEVTKPPIDMILSNLRPRSRVVIPIESRAQEEPWR